METPYAQANVPAWLEKLQAIVEGQQDTHDDPVDVESENPLKEWMVLSDLHRPFESNTQTNLAFTHDWHQDRVHYTEQQIGEMPTWIKTNKDQSNQTAQENYQKSHFFLL